MNGWSHDVAYSHIYEKPTPQLHHQPCGRTFYATDEQTAKIRAEHDCAESRKADTQADERIAS